MELTDAQKQAMASWVEAGVGLSDIQKRLQAEFGLSLTYMDVRFLVIDLGLDIQDAESSTPAPAPEPELDQPAAIDDAVAEPEALPADGGVSVEVDRLMKPGALVSGNVVFSDGTRASWSLDQLGRLALDAGDPDYRPGEQDLQAFQEQLREALQTQGF